MTINLHLPEKNEILRPTITVIGVGGAGGNAVNNMIASQLEGVNFVVANTDAQALDHSLTERTIQLGAGLTKGLGAGANPDVGRGAAEEARDEIAAYIEGSNMVFITAGMGGGTGTGAAAVVARIAKEQGVLTVGVVTKPFTFEGTHRMKMAEAGLKELQEYVDTLIIIPNQNLFRIANEKTTFADAFKMADEVLHSGVRGVTDLMVKPGLINLDFADIRSVMREMGKAMMGTGEASGDRRAVEAAEAAISNPLLDDVSLKGARALLINITGGPDMTLFEVDEAANRVREEVDPEANIIFGSTFNDDMQGRMRVSVVATGIDAPAQSAAAPQKFIPAGEPKKPYSYSSVSGSTAKAPEPVKPATASRVSVFDTQREPVRAYSSAPIETSAPAPAPRPVAAEQRPVVPAPVPQPVRAERQEQPATQESFDMPQPSRSRAADYTQEERAPYYEEEPKSAVMPRESASATSLFDNERMMPPPVVSARRETRNEPQPREEHSSAAANSKGFFQRALDVGRVFSGKQPEMGERIQIVQRSNAQPVETTERKAKAAAAAVEEEQYLDIPAFLRRQAN